ncbi:protein MANNAN SYNTHESIS-RELATED 1-like isoform X1 [Senna tora]|uniref:O-fucosyltransferase family protein n=1 Tax=Senna tora TaxID=362788 RepID=A0A835CJ37_9FABA|nr:protein MANNAN SYNTHESIS-RELATED 1-like isoform X1 [Senna tora]
MGLDLRQVVAAILTLAMFVMLGNMIKRDHFDPLQEVLPGGTMDLENGKFGVSHVRKNVAPWKGVADKLKPCWLKPYDDDVEQTKGFVTVSLTNGPEYHISQIADAVVVARQLGAKLVLPEIRGSQPGDKRNFEEIYDVDAFMKSMEGLVRVVKDLPDHISGQNIAVVKVPNRVTEDYIAARIEPIYRSKGNIRLATYFPSINMRKGGKKSDTDSVACLAMFGSLELQPELHELIESMVERLRTLSHESNGQFIAVDLRVDLLDGRGCQGGNDEQDKSCFNAHEIAVFLRKIGFDKDTSIYVTESKEDSSLDSFKDLFPKTYTKDAIMPADKKTKFLDSEGSGFEKVIDFYISTQSDVFVPASPGLFYANVAGKRIGSAKTQIFVPADISDQYASASDFLSPCAACKSLRRKCPQDCVLAPYFPSSNPQRFASVHKVFGAGNITKMLQQLPEHLRGEAAECMCIEASLRVEDPVYGCVRIVSQLQQQIIQTQHDIMKCIVLWALNKFEITHGCQLQTQILKGLLGSIDDSNIKDNVIVVHCYICFSINRITKSSKLKNAIELICIIPILGELSSSTLKISFVSVHATTAPRKKSPERISDLKFPVEVSDPCTRVGGDMAVSSAALWVA